MSIRPIKKLSISKPTMEGAGVRLRRAFGFGNTSEYDPFLLLDDSRNDRPDDYRTEILDLMKTQTVKNAIIVPTGAKGGFIVKRPAADGPPGIEAYVTLIRAMLAPIYRHASWGQAFHVFRNVVA